SSSTAACWRSRFRKATMRSFTTIRRSCRLEPCVAAHRYRPSRKIFQPNCTLPELYGSEAPMRTFALICCLAAGCSGSVGSSNVETAQAENGGDGRDVWFKSTFGNETFLTMIFPTLPGGFPLAFDQVLVAPRAQRFTQFGVINDPD